MSAVIHELLALDIALARIHSTVVERPWALLCYNTANPQHYDSNSARRIRAAEPAAASAELAAFYRGHGITPRVKCNDLTQPAGFAAELIAQGWQSSASVTQVLAWEGAAPPQPVLAAGETIERAGPLDLEDVVRVQVDGFGGDTDVWVRESLRRELGHPALRWYLARVDGVAAAAAAVFDNAGQGLLTNVATVPRYRGRGLASALVARAQAEAAGALLLEVVEPNAERIYRRAGFVRRDEHRETMCWLERSAAQ